ncbi:ATP phosphoribosyltransferase regulatory subunit [Aquisalimonas asiatica]|uniref:ATP phosphoribosyltransferase regulatory subunit n=1 Tax=Aquisalimonas asiatica TaxID=406100 RepID=A0A1H8QZI4_9GAMM|nr:ATP phosphoribosyltransferase regulatory subunit [Aquisalimonas asiatica]SEO59496.1 ATP phosphoribosyltransferase regulatory subunit [Aquisalimonas asiatica]
MKEAEFSRANRWLLPDGVDEVLPPRAAALEVLRRELLDAWRNWGYELVMPPVIEYLDSLLIGTGPDLDLQTFKLTDQLSGRMMGIRADMTPQAARIDAHQLKRSGPTRLCYLGTVLNTRPEGPGRSRNPVQLGAELFGHGGVESDVEIIALMMETLRIAGLPTPHLDIGHVGIYRALASEAGLDLDTENRLFDCLQRKAAGEIRDLLEGVAPGPARDRLAALTHLNGSVEVLDHAGEQLAGAGESVQTALRHLWALSSAVERQIPEVTLHFDLAELRGYRFHTGVVFAAFAPGCGQEVARGGRYDGIGEVFGRPRSATGFSADLKNLLALSERELEPRPTGILAPWGDASDLMTAVRELRANGERVVVELPGATVSPEELGCDRQLVESNGAWKVVPLTE